MTINEKNELLLANLGLIKTIVTKYAHAGNDSEKWEDSFQDAVVEFLEKIDRYDASKGTLSTFIWPHLQNCIIEKNSRTPAHLRKVTKKIRDYREYLESESNGSVEESSVAEALGLSLEKMNDYLREEKSCNPESLYYETGNVKLSCQEIEFPEGSPEENLIRKEEVKILQGAWNKLNEEEKTILSLRTTYGTNLEEPKTLRQVAEIMGSNRTTINQKEKKASAHLRRVLQNQGMCA